MLNLSTHIQEAAAQLIQAHFGAEIDPASLNVQETRKEFEGELTLVIFPLAKHRLGNLQEVGEKLGQLLTEKLDFVQGFTLVKGFLNLSMTEAYWRNFLAQYGQDDGFLTRTDGNGTTIAVEFCSPNTNKPLHLGHLRNIVLGDSLNSLLEANGYDVHPVCLYNDRGVAICRSMYAWQQDGGNTNPASAGKKGDAFVGDYYVKFANDLKEEVKELVAQGIDEKEAEKQAPSIIAVNEMLVQWENGDPEIRAMWKQMNEWVYEAHAETFKSLGVSFEKFYYESDVYEEGKEIVEEGEKQGDFYKKDDQSIWVDLEDAGLDQKLLLRGNGTSVYITQDLAVAAHKQADFDVDRSVYVVGNEQDYHFKVLFEVLKKLEKPYADGLFHMSYGMVELPHGKMKSRAGNVVEIDDLVKEVKAEVQAATSEQGKVDGMSEEELDALYHTLTLGAIKYFLVKVEPKKGMLYDPAESVALTGSTGPFIQYSYARTQSLNRRAGEVTTFAADMDLEESLHPSERKLLFRLFRYRGILKEAGDGYNPAMIANYAYDLAREFNGFWRDCHVLQADKPGISAQRLALASFTGNVLRASLAILGIQAPARM
ncbi:MAG: arginine--tRNA ligase [Bacteroidia bacterium]